MRPKRGLAPCGPGCAGEVGFTLIELLVVIAIIAILAAILLPVFVIVIKKARLANCISNQKQIVLAAKMYVADWDGQYPVVGSYAGGGWFGTGWTDGDPWGDLIDPYVKAKQEIYRCPVVRNHPAPSYAWNRHLTGAPEALIEYPSTCPVCWDWTPGYETAPGIPVEEGGNWSYPAGDGLPSEGDMYEAVTRHFDGLVVGFSDGHAKFLHATRWTSTNVGGKFMLSHDDRSFWPPPEYRGTVISMHCLGDPMREPRER